MSEVRFSTQAERLFKQAIAGRAEAAEAFFVEQKRTRIGTASGHLSPSHSSSLGVGLRILRGGRQGFASTTDLTEVGLDEVAVLALQAVDAAEVDPYAQPLPGQVPERDRLQLLLELQINDVTAERLMRLWVDRAMNALRSSLGRSGKQPAASVGLAIAHVEIHNTNGLSAAYDDSSASLGVEAESHLRRLFSKGAVYRRFAAKAPDLWRRPRAAARYWMDKEQQEGSASQWARSLVELDPVDAGETAGYRAVSRHAALRLQTQEIDVVFDSAASRAFLSLLAPSFSAEAVAFGRSKLADQLGTAIAAPIVTIIDDGTDARTGAAAPWDGEGVPTQRTALIEGGILHSFMHNVKSAARFGVASTGNASRAGFASAPGIGPTTLTLQPGEETQDQLLARMGDGLLVTSLNGLHLANVVSGDFSLGLEGFVVRGGRKAEPVKEMTVAGNILTLLKNVKAIGSDLLFDGGTVGAPSMWVGKLTVTGEEPALS